VKFTLGDDHNLDSVSLLFPALEPRTKTGRTFSSQPQPRSIQTVAASHYWIQSFIMGMWRFLPPHPAALLQVHSLAGLLRAIGLNCSSLFRRLRHKWSAKIRTPNLHIWQCLTYGSPRGSTLSTPTEYLPSRGISMPRGYGENTRQNLNPPYVPECNCRSQV
jgi:hypothetical protein